MPDRPTTIATFNQRCPACDDRIHEGDKLTLNDDEEWVHAECADE